MHRSFGWAGLLLGASLALLCAGCELDAATSSGSAYWAELVDARGLGAGDRVYVAGVRVGRVTQVALVEGHAKVTFTIDDESTLSIHNDACIGVSWFGFEEAAHLRLEPGTAAAGALASDAQITCLTASANERMNVLSDRLDALLTAALTGKGTVARLLQDEALAAKVDAFFSAPPATHDVEPPAAASSQPEAPAAESAPAAPAKPRAPKAPPKAPPKTAPKSGIIDPFTGR